MGYSADRISGGTIIIPRANTDKFVQLIAPKEERFGHISWCDTVDTYIKNCENDTYVVTNEMLVDFGFVVGNTPDSITLETWGGDKIGSSWDDVWEVLAQVVDPTVDYQWVMHGEDGQLWGERLYNGANTKHEVQLVIAS